MRKVGLLLGVVFIFALGIIFSLGCGATNDRNLYANSSPGGRGSNSASYSSLQTNLFRPYCTGCHSQFGSYQGVVGDLNNIYLRVVVQQNMPRGSRLNTTLLQALANWAQSGAPNN